MNAAILIKKLSMTTLGAVVALSTAMSTQQAQAFSLYSDRVSFQSQVGNSKVDDYENPGYLNGDIIQGDGFNAFSDTAMSNVLGETQYQATTPFGYSGYNLVLSPDGDPNQHAYCAGCNGSFNLDFTKTSVSNTFGVFGAGFDIVGDTDSFAHVTFGDDSSQDVMLNGINFFGVTADEGIKSFYIGDVGGLPTTSNYILIDNLTVGAQAMSTSVPEPGSVLGLFAFSAVFANSAFKRFRSAKV